MLDFIKMSFFWIELWIFIVETTNLHTIICGPTVVRWCVSFTKKTIQIHVCVCIASYFGTQDIYRSSGGLKGQPVSWLILQVKQYTHDVKGNDIRNQHEQKILDTGKLYTRMCNLNWSTSWWDSHATYRTLLDAEM